MINIFAILFKRVCELVMKLRQQVVDINSRIQVAGREIVTANIEFQSVMKQRKNVNLTIEHLESGMINI